MADILKGDHDFSLMLVYLKFKIERKLGGSGLKKDNQGKTLREVVKEKLEKEPSAHIIICGHFDGSPGQESQEEGTGVEDLITKRWLSQLLAEGIGVSIHTVTLEHRDVGINGEL